MISKQANSLDKQIWFNQLSLILLVSQIPDDFSQEL